MLKKLVRYGNSNALILDRAIMELLNIKEGCVVRLHTDGKSLIITPELTQKQEQISESGTEKVQEHLQNYKEAAQSASQQLSAENHEKLQHLVKEIMARHSNAFIGYDHQAFLSEVDMLAETKYHGDKLSPAFIAEVKEIQARYSPGLASAQQELANLAKKFNC